MRRISYRISRFERVIVVAGAVAVFLLPVFTPDVRASEPRWYVGLSVPVMFLDDSESVTSGRSYAPDHVPPGLPPLVPYSANAVNEYKAGFKVSGMLGYEFGNGFRIEGEVFFARANVSKLTYSGVTTETPQGPLSIPGERNIPVSGPADQLGGMANVWYDFSTGSRWRPFIGGGLGVVQVNQGDLEYETNGAVQHALDYVGQGQSRPPGTPQPRPPFVPEVSGTDTVLAYKVGGGLGYELTDAITVQASYRFFRTNQLEFNGRDAMNGATVKATTDLQAHLFEIGVRYRF